ncbi:MAG: crossover junction endodeoxyribonuclease RuvC [Eubacteriales bacterium]
MRILGIDPGFATIGFGLVDSNRGQQTMLQYGTINTTPDQDFSQRLVTVYDDMTQLLSALQPEVVAMEQLFWGHNVTTGIGVSHARGVLVLAVAQAGISLFEYTPMQIKQAVAGYGKAEKRQVMDMTRRLLKMNEIPRPDDAADALAVALCHGRTHTSLLHQKGINLLAGR